MFFPIHPNTTTSQIKLNTHSDQSVNKINNSMKEKVTLVNTNLGNASSEEYIDFYNGIKLN